MINEATLEGIVTKVWVYNGDTFLRLASYRDPDLPEYKLDNNRDHADFVTVRFPKDGPVQVTASTGDHLRVHGFIQSRDYNETLAAFLKDSNHQLSLPVDVDPTKYMASRSMNEIICRRFVRLPRTDQQQASVKGNDNSAEGVAVKQDPLPPAQPVNEVKQPKVKKSSKKS